MFYVLIVIQESLIQFIYFLCTFIKLSAIFIHLFVYIHFFTGLLKQIYDLFIFMYDSLI